MARNGTPLSTFDGNVHIRHSDCLRCVDYNKGLNSLNMILVLNVKVTYFTLVYALNVCSSADIHNWQ